jgi:hypothetical protein
MEDRTLLYHRNPSALAYENLQPCAPVMEVDMRSSVNNVFFDDEATLAMGAAFDRACISLGRSARHDSARELIAKRIIETATKGERDPVRLHSQVFMRFWMPDSVSGVSGPGELPTVIRTAVARTG